MRRISSSLWATLSVMRKNLLLMCLMFFPANILSFLANRMVYLLFHIKFVFNCVALGFHEVLTPHNHTKNILYAYQFRLSITSYINLMFSLNIHNSTLSHWHHGSGVPLWVPMYPKHPSTHHKILLSESAVRYCTMLFCGISHPVPAWYWHPPTRI